MNNSVQALTKWIKSFLKSANNNKLAINNLIKLYAYYAKYKHYSLCVLLMYHLFGEYVSKKNNFWKNKG